MRLMWPIVLLGALLAISVAWDRPRSGVELTTAYISIETLDPQLARASDDIKVAYGLFEGLLSFEPTTFTIRPGVAEAWSVSDDGRTWTFRLHPDAKWSDGSAVTAEDFRFAWRLGMMVDAAPAYIQFLLYIRGGQAFHDWSRTSLEALPAAAGFGLSAERLEAARRRAAESERQFDELVGVRVIDARTLEVELERAVPFFAEIAACWPLFPLHRGAVGEALSIDGATGMIRRDPQWVKPGRIVSNGPYRLAAWQFKGDVDLVANEHYWDRESVGPRSVRVLAFKDPNGMFNAYHTGAVDLVLGAAVEFLPELAAAARAGERNDVHHIDAFGTYYYGLNCRPTLPDGRPNPFADPRVRRAFGMAVNKRQLVENVTRLHQQVATTFVPPGSIAGYPPVQGLDYDVEAARTLLAEAGYPGGRNFPAVVINYNTGGGHDKQAEAIKKMWESTLGVRVDLRGQEWKVHLQQVRSGNFIVARMGWFGDYSDPTTFLDLLRTDNGNNDTGFSDGHYDALLEKAADTLDAEQRMRILAEAERYAMNEMLPMIPLYQYRSFHLYDPERVRDVSSHPRNMHLYHRMRVMRDGGAVAGRNTR